jgi:uncharacterized membrane protein (DUF441 family)
MEQGSPLIATITQSVGLVLIVVAVFGAIFSLAGEPVFALSATPSVAIKLCVGVAVTGVFLMGFAELISIAHGILATLRKSPAAGGDVQNPPE